MLIRKVGKVLDNTVQDHPSIVVFDMAAKLTNRDDGELSHRGLWLALVGMIMYSPLDKISTTRAEIPVTGSRRWVGTEDSEERFRGHTLQPGFHSR